MRQCNLISTTSVSICHTVSKRMYMLSNFFGLDGRGIILVFEPHRRYKIPKFKASRGGC